VTTSSPQRRPHTLLLKFAYGALFVVALPGLLAIWSWRLDNLGAIVSPINVTPFLALAGLLAGASLMLAGMHALWVFGKGLPMNAFPPKHLVERSVFRLFPHPIYVGFCLCVFSYFALVESRAGFWIAGPVAIGAIIALVFGYEGPELRQRLGEPRVHPLFSLPDEGDARLSLLKRVALIVLAWGPWAVAYSLLSGLPTPASAEELRFSFEWGLPRPAYWLWIYSLAYPFAALAPLVFRDGREARLTIQGIWTASAVGFLWMLLFPCKATLLLPVDGSHDWLVVANRTLDAEWLACPSFHSAWALTAAGIYGRNSRVLRIPSFILAVLIAASCIGTGSHALIDVLAGVPLAALALNFQKIANTLVETSQNIANSWKAWRTGQFRIISHATWTAASAFAGTLIVLGLVGSDRVWPLLVVIVSGVSGALGFGWLVEGKQLSRPFGYFGFLLGAMAALAIIWIFRPEEAVALAAAIAVAAPITQALGRGRCLVQGCCHGRHGQGPWTIRVRAPQSRIVCVAGMDDTPVYATQLIAAILNLAITGILLIAWRTHAAALFVGGFYLVLTALARFAEEGWRGEPQTPHKYGLSIYQWICVALVLTGIGISMLASPPVPGAVGLSTISIVTAAGVALVLSFAMSVDWPDSNLPLSRLAPPLAARQSRL